MRQFSEHDVVVVGAGPTGLTLAAELALAGVDVVIVERRVDRCLVGSRAGGLHSRTIEVFDQRGIADRFLAAGYTAQVVWTSVTFRPATRMGLPSGRTTSSASSPTGSTSWAFRSTVDGR